MPRRNIQLASQILERIFVQIACVDPRERSAHELRNGIRRRGSRAGRDLGPATKARTVARLLGFGRMREERDAITTRRSRGTNRPAINPGGAHGDEEEAVEAAISR